jgi:hypothetical protein
MQKEIEAANPNTRIRILGVNLSAADDPLDIEAACLGRDIPLLQDTFAEHVQVLWNMVWRDVVILDENNVEVDRYNLDPPNDLRIATKFDELKNKLLSAAGE